ncbi:unnamed protein product [Gadus morhua 'NCC']
MRKREGSGEDKEDSHQGSQRRGRPSASRPGPGRNKLPPPKEGHRDMVTLASQLPPLTEGASAWIRKFETGTSGDVLARKMS